MRAATQRGEALQTPLQILAPLWLGLTILGWLPTALMSRVQLDWSRGTLASDWSEGSRHSRPDDENSGPCVLTDTDSDQDQDDRESERSLDGLTASFAKRPAVLPSSASIGRAVQCRLADEPGQHFHRRC